MNAQQKRDLHNNTVRLNEVREQIKFLKSQEKLLVEFMNVNLGIGSHVIGEHVVDVIGGCRSSLDTKELAKSIGAKFMEKFTKYTTYTSVKVKKVSKTVEKTAS